MGEEAIIEVRELVVRFGDNTVLEDVSFRIVRGEVFVILGGSGCGKTTLLRHMIGLAQPFSGEIFVAGEEIGDGDEARLHRALRKIGVLFQGSALIGSMTLAQNVRLPLEEFSGFPRRAMDRIVKAKLRSVDLAGFENHLPSEISGGMKKRAGLARAMALNPEILFLDEPSAGLDPVTSAEIDQLILRINKESGTTIVIVTHELASIFSVADRVIMLDKNKKGIIAEGDPTYLKDNSDNRFVRQFFNRDPNLGEEVL